EDQDEVRRDGTDRSVRGHALGLSAETNPNKEMTMTLKARLVNAALTLLVLGTAASARAEQASTQNAAAAATRTDIGKTLGFVPQFFLKFPEEMLPGVWDEMKTLQMNPGTALPGRTKELIGLAVAAQVPC